MATFLCYASKYTSSTRIIQLRALRNKKKKKELTITMSILTVILTSIGLTGFLLKIQEVLSGLT